MSGTQRFLRQVEDSIGRINRNVLSERIGTITATRMEELAKVLANLRADYLESALGASWTAKDVEASDLQTKRKLYEEALAAFDALERAVERNYVAIEG